MLEKQKNNRYVAFNFKITENINSNWDLKNWFDGVVLLDSIFLELLNNEIELISPTRWKINKNLSSGVWQQLSTKVENNNLLTYYFPYSLIKHDGNEDSKMNTYIRKKNKLITKNFIDEKNNK